MVLIVYHVFHDAACQKHRGMLRAQGILLYRASQAPSDKRYLQVEF